MQKTTQEILKHEMYSIFTIAPLTHEGRDAMDRVLDAARKFSTVLIDEVPESKSLHGSLDLLRLCVDTAKHGIGDNDLRNRRAEAFEVDQIAMRERYKSATTIDCPSCFRKQPDTHTYCLKCGVILRA